MEYESVRVCVCACVYVYVCVVCVYVCCSVLQCVAVEVKRTFRG